MTQPVPITIDIVSDIVCPWCHIGFAQMTRALGQLDGKVEAGVRWHPFQLAPGLPPEGQLMSDYVRERYGATPEQSRGNRSRIQDAGAALGLEINFREEGRIYNTLKGHQLLVWAGEQGKQTALKLALFNAYFRDGLNVSDDAVLLDAAERVGLDRAEAEAALHEPRFAAQVKAETDYWMDNNVTGVPAFIINGKYMIPGAQDADTLVRYIERVLEKEAA